MLIQATAKLRDELNLEELEQKERPVCFPGMPIFLELIGEKQSF